MKNNLIFSKYLVIGAMCIGVSGAYAASSVRSLGGGGTYNGASNAVAANLESVNSESSVRSGSLRVVPSSGTSGTSTKLSAGTVTNGRVATTPRLSIGQYLGGTTSISGGSSVRPQTPSSGSSNGDGSFDPSLSGELRQQIDQLQRDVENLRDTSDDMSNQILDKQDALVAGQEGYIIIDDNTNEIFVDIDALQDALETVSGKDGREIILGSDENNLLWQYEGDGNSWNILIPKADITGPAGTADLANYPTKEEMNIAITDAIEAFADNYITADDLNDSLIGKEETINKVASITPDNQDSMTSYPSVGAVVQWTNEQISSLSSDGLPVNPDNILDNTITESKLSSDLQNKINGKEDVINKTQTITNDVNQYPSAAAVYNALETINQNITNIENVASGTIPKPADTQINTDGVYVLTYSPTNGFAWETISR